MALHWSENCTHVMYRQSGSCLCDLHRYPLLLDWTTCVFGIKKNFHTPCHYECSEGSQWMYFILLIPTEPNTDLKAGDCFYAYTSKQEYVMIFKTNTGQKLNLTKTLNPPWVYNWYHDVIFFPPLSMHLLQWLENTFGNYRTKQISSSINIAFWTMVESLTMYLYANLYFL